MTELYNDTNTVIQTYTTDWLS